MNFRPAFLSGKITSICIGDLKSELRKADDFRTDKGARR